MKLQLILPLILFSFPITAQENIKVVGENTYRWGEGNFSLNDTLVFQSSANETDECWSNSYALLRGYVGNMITLNTIGADHCDGTARVNSWNTLYTFRVSEEKIETVSLLDLFPETDLVDALSGDSYIKRRYSKNTRESIRNALQSDYERCDQVTGHTLNRFAFHHLSEEKVAIRLFLKKCDSYSETVLQLGFYMTPNSTLLNQLRLSEENGLLMHHLE